MRPPKASQLSVLSAVSIGRVFLKLFLFQEKLTFLILAGGQSNHASHPAGGIV